MSKPFKFKAILSRSTTDMVKSKIRSVDLAEITLDAYMSPEEFARLISEKFTKSFTVEIK